MTDTDASATPADSLNWAVSDLVLQLIGDESGHRCTTVSTYIRGDLISVVVRETSINGEPGLVLIGEAERVRNTRRAAQQAMDDEMVAGVEALTGREVLSFEAVGKMGRVVRGGGEPSRYGREVHRGRS